MKKHDEGYVMLLVVVVIVVLSIVSAGLMSMGLRNMKGQKASIDRMTDKYAAQGEVEKLVAVLGQEAKLSLSEPNTLDSDQTQTKADLAQYLRNCGAEPTDIDIQLAEKNGSPQYSSCSYTIAGTVQKETAQITYEIHFACSLTKDDGSDTEYTLKTTSITYKTYEIDTTPEGGGG